MAKFIFYISTRYVGSEVSEIVEIPDEDLEGLNEHDCNQLVADYYEDWVQTNSYQGWEEIE